MVFSYNWLQEFFDDKLPPAEELAHKVGLHSFELESVEEKDGDYLIDWDVLPNRSSDCLCYAGIAQELSTICEIQLRSDIGSKLLLSDYVGSGDFRTADRLDYSVHPDSGMLRATKRVVTGVAVAPSPDWLRERISCRQCDILDTNIPIFGLWSEK